MFNNNPSRKPNIGQYSLILKAIIDRLAEISLKNKEKTKEGITNPEEYISNKATNRRRRTLKLSNAKVKQNTQTETQSNTNQMKNLCDNTFTKS